MYQVSLNSLLYFQWYAPDKIFIAKIKKGKYLRQYWWQGFGSCNSAIPFMALYQCIKFHLWDMLQTSLLMQKLEREITVITCDRVTFACTLHFLFYTFRDMLWTSFLLQKLRREVTL